MGEEGGGESYLLTSAKNPPMKDMRKYDQSKSRIHIDVSQCFFHRTLMHLHKGG